MSSLPRFRTVLLALALSVSAGNLIAANPAGPHKFVFPDEDGTKIEVEAVAGSRCADNPCPLVIAMHGLTRNAIATRDNWLELAEKFDLLVVAPYLDTTRFPTRLYQQGGVVGEPDRSRWLYNRIERLYDHLIATGRAKGDGYILFGHSAGAQFAHRMAMFMPKGRMREIIVANAGFYTLPTGRSEAGGYAYPFSLDETPATEEDRRAVLSRKLDLMLGDQDNDPKHHQLNTSEGANAQGAHRFARGKFFFEAARQEAERLGVPFGWRLTIVPGVDHDNHRMTKAAATLLFGNR